MGQKVVLKPWSPKEVHKDQKKMKVKRKSERKTNRKIRKKEKKKKGKKKGKKRWERKARVKEPYLSGKSKIKEEKIKESLLVGPKEVRRVILAKKEPLFALLTNILLHASPCVGKLLKEFKDVFPEDIPHGLPPLRVIEHYIDFPLRASLLNRLAHRTNPEKAKNMETSQ
ncbi:hypothetical protein CR513_42409, partial [Mucuna pruriens]